MNRRLSNRLPPAARLRACALPLVLLFVTSTLVVCPIAWARVESGSAEVRFVTQSYAKNELTKTMPANPNTDLDRRIGAELASLFNAMSGSISGNAGRFAQLDSLKTKAPERDAYVMHAAAMRDTPLTAQADMDRVRSYFGLEVQKAARRDVAQKFAAYTKMLNLAKFNLNFGSLFGRPAAPPVAASGTVRYGLVVQDIVPDTDVPRLASIDDITDEMRFAGHADVKWAIEPVTEGHGRKVFDGLTADVPPPLAPDEGGWKLHVPRASFHTDASTDSVEDYSKVNASALPGARFVLTQDEEFYQLTYRTTMQGKRQGVEHTVKLPIAGTVAVGRRFNDKFELVESSAYNVLYDKSLPMLSVHQMHVERRLRAELSHAMPDRQAVGLAYRGQAKGPAENPAEKDAAGSLSYTHDF